MPFRHSENLDDQQFVVDKFDELNNKSELWNKFHRASLISFFTIKKYGRFKHRDKLT